MWFTSLVDLCEIASRYVLDKVKDFRPFFCTSLNRIFVPQPFGLSKVRSLNNTNNKTLFVLYCSRLFVALTSVEHRLHLRKMQINLFFRLVYTTFAE